MKLMFMILILSSFVFSGCTHMRPIEKVEIPLNIGIHQDSLKSLDVKVYDSTTFNNRFSASVKLLEKSLIETFKSEGILITDNSPNVLELDVNRLMIAGDGIIFCQAIADITVKAKKNSMALGPKRFISTKNGYFCAFGDGAKKMEKPTREALGEAIAKILDWFVKYGRD